MREFHLFPDYLAFDSIKLQAKFHVFHYEGTKLNKAQHLGRYHRAIEGKNIQD